MSINVLRAKHSLYTVYWMSFLLWLSGSFVFISPVTRPAKLAARIISARNFTGVTLSGAASHAFYTLSHFKLRLCKLKPGKLRPCKLRFISLTARFADHVAWSLIVLFCTLFVCFLSCLVYNSIVRCQSRANSSAPTCTDVRSHSNVRKFWNARLRRVIVMYIYTFAHCFLFPVLILTNDF